MSIMPFFLLGTTGGGDNGLGVLGGWELFQRLRFPF